MTPTHYQTLQITPRATAAQIKQAYRQLVKRYHPDVSGTPTTIDRIVAINAAYEVLSDARQKHNYDRSLQRDLPLELEERIATNRASRPAQPRRSAPDMDSEVELWLNSVYAPVNRSITAILKPFKVQLLELSADPFDDDLIGKFGAYLLDCQRYLKKAEKNFHALPNPANLAGIAANLYYCLNQLTDAIEELNRYTTCYNDDYLHSGQELFKIAANLQKEAKKQLKNIY